MLNKPNLKILAIETSCDETAAAVIEANRLPASRQGGPTTANRMDMKCRILSNVVFSQINIHQKFGGVFPEYASRAHSEKIIPVVEQALACNKNTLKRGLRKNVEQASACCEPDLMAVTVGPGLIGSLLIGVNFAKTYAYANNLPIIGINHLLGHIYSNWANKPLPKFPALILIVSGGHTGLYLMSSHEDIQTLGETLDDAAGEAFDKVAKLLQLDYPGGPAIAACAAKIQNPPLGIHSKCQIKSQIPNSKSKTKPYTLNAIAFPRSMLDRKDYNFSFSGLKTAVLYKVKELTKRYTLNAIRSQVAYEFQQTVIDILVGKTVQAALEFKPKSVCLCGGVAANRELRRQLSSVVGKLSWHPPFHTPHLELTTDNAAMIGVAASYHLYKVTGWNNIKADANLKL